MSDAPPAPAPVSRATAGIPKSLDATLVLIRHGESTWVAEGRVQGRADPPLSELGRRQAALLAARLADPLASPPLPVPAGRPLACWHSPLDRAASTARSVASAWRPALELRADDRLREIGQGEWEGLTGTEIRARYAGVRAGWRQDPVHVHAPGGESLPEVHARAVSFADQQLVLFAADVAARRGSRVASLRQAPVGAVGAGTGKAVPWSIIVAHEGLLRVVLLALLDLPLDAFWRFPLGLCGISVVDIRGGRPSLRAHNLRDHLAPLGASAVADATRDRGAGL